MRAPRQPTLQLPGALAFGIALCLGSCEAPPPTIERTGDGSIRPLPQPAPLPPPPPDVIEIADDFEFLEGPARGADRLLYFADVLGDSIFRLDPRSDGIELWREDSGGASGLAFGPDDSLYAAEAKARRVTTLTRESRTILVEAIEGKRLNGPNDIAIDARGGVYFSDPFYGDEPARELDVEAVYYVPPGEAAKPVVTELERPNGVLLADRGRRLYITDHAAGRLLYYPVLEAGELGEGVEVARGLRRPDGLTRDRHQAVYVATATGVKVYSRSGEELETIALPSKPTNCAFAGADGTLYVTTKKALARVNVPRARKRERSKTRAPVSVAAAGEARRLYATSCASCHGPRGRADGPTTAGLEVRPPSFADPAWHRARTNADIRRAIVDGGTAKGGDSMPAHPDLADQPEVLRALVQTVRGFRR